MGPLVALMTRQLAVVGASESPSGAMMETVRPNLPVTVDSSETPRTLLSMLRGARFPFEVAAIGPSASHAPRRPSDEGTIATSPPAKARAGRSIDKENASESQRAARFAVKEVRLRFQRLRQHARSIFEHHLYLLSIDYPHDVSVTKFPVPNELA